MHLKMSSAKWRPFCPGGDELIDNWCFDLTEIYEKQEHNTTEEIA